ncbi:MAG: rhomboid family intramembrane serine protease [Calditrichaeota bacterium]|nr:MAG: rhomboid family intramembrane serine protease [Calditrichota bacterium]
MKRKFFISHIIIGVTVAFFILQNLSQTFLGFDLPLSLLAKINQFIMRGQFWRLITPILLHGSILHIGFNMYALFMIGPTLERKYGTWPFIELYLVGGLWGNTLSFLMSPNPSLGASTAIFGLIAAQGVYVYHNRHLLGSSARPILMNIVMVIAVNLMLGLSPGIDNWGHLGGLLGGLFFAWFAGPSFGIEEDFFGQNVVIKQKRQPVLILALAVMVAASAIAIRLAFG